MLLRQRILYANGKSKVGKVEVYKCPYCKDGKQMITEKDIEKVKRMMVLARNNSTIDGREYISLEDVDEILDILKVDETNDN